MNRSIYTLNEGWRFAKGSEMPTAEAYSEVRIPHDWAIGGQVDPDAPLNVQQAFLKRSAIGWYTYPLQLTEAQCAGCVMLDFGGVFECATVWVNGLEAGNQRYGYTAFRLDVTAFVRPGLNDLLVRVDNTAEPADRWYSGCGIYRPVRLIVADAEHLDERLVQVHTEWLGNDAVLHIDTGTAMPVTAALTDACGAQVSYAAGAESIELPVKSPERWSAEQPTLYTLTLSLTNGDAVSLRIGFRQVSMGPAHGLVINGQPVKLHGVCVHQDMGCMGIAATREMWYDRLVKLKKMGCNALRLAHHMHSSDMLDLCDEMGFYVYAECFDKWHSGLYGRYFDQDWQHDLDAMLLRDRNRPSILFWGVGNEVEVQGQPLMLDTLKMLVKRVKELDSTRPVSYAMNPHFKRSGKPVDYSKVMDIQKLVDETDDL